MRTYLILSRFKAVLKHKKAIFLRSARLEQDRVIDEREYFAHWVITLTKQELINEKR